MCCYLKYNKFKSCWLLRSNAFIFLNFYLMKFLRNCVFMEWTMFIFSGHLPGNPVSLSPPLECLRQWQHHWCRSKSTWSTSICYSGKWFQGFSCNVHGEVKWLLLKVGWKILTNGCSVFTPSPLDAWINHTSFLLKCFIWAVGFGFCSGFHCSALFSKWGSQPASRDLRRNRLQRQILRPLPSALNGNLWGGPSPATCVLTRHPGCSGTWSSLRTTGVCRSLPCTSPWNLTQSV